MLNWFRKIFKKKKEKLIVKSSIDFKKISTDWNADPVSPEVDLQVEDNDLIMDVFLNYFAFTEFKHGDKVKIRFLDCSEYSLNTCNDEGYYYGQYRIKQSELPWGEFYELKSGVDRVLPEPVIRIQKDFKDKKHYIFFFKDATFECLASNFELKFYNDKGSFIKKEFSYKLRPGYGSEELLIEFVKTGEADDFIKMLLDLLSKGGFQYGDTSDVWMNDEIWIHLNSMHGNVTLTRDIYDLFFILADKNQQDILKIDELLMKSGKFHKEKVDFDDYKKKE